MRVTLDEDNFYHEGLVGIELSHYVKDGSELAPFYPRQEKIIIPWRKVVASVKRWQARRPLPKRKKVTAKDVELAVVSFFGARQNLMVPNVSWGMIHYEADLVVLRPSGYAEEVEIKVTRADLIADGRKHHRHNSNMFRKLWFAIPENLVRCIEFIPERAGILVIGSNGVSNVLRQPTVNGAAQKLTQAQQYQLARLGALRIWGLKRELARR